MTASRGVSRCLAAGMDEAVGRSALKTASWRLVCRGFLKNESASDYDILVVGAGHACARRLSLRARMGLCTALFTMNLDPVAQMSCNPAIGGIAKGHLVCEIDALGGVTGQVASSMPWGKSPGESR